jgi:hypothetical protein
MDTVSDSKGIERPPIVVTLLVLAATVVLGLLLVQFVAGLIATVIRFALILVAFYVVGRLGLYLLRRG